MIFYKKSCLVNEAAFFVTVDFGRAEVLVIPGRFRWFCAGFAVYGLCR